jgi:hypothetical protein
MYKLLDDMSMKIDMTIKNMEKNEKKGDYLQEKVDLYLKTITEKLEPIFKYTKSWF